MLFWPFVFVTGFVPGFVAGIAFTYWLEILYPPPDQRRHTRIEDEADEILSRETETNGL